MQALTPVLHIKVLESRAHAVRNVDVRCDHIQDSINWGKRRSPMTGTAHIYVYDSASHLGTATNLPYPTIIRLPPILGVKAFLTVQQERDRACQ